MSHHPTRSCGQSTAALGDGSLTVSSHCQSTAASGNGSLTVSSHCQSTAALGNGTSTVLRRRHGCWCMHPVQGQNIESQPTHHKLDRYPKKNPNKPSTLMPHSPTSPREDTKTDRGSDTLAPHLTLTPPRPDKRHAFRKRAAQRLRAQKKIKKEVFSAPRIELGTFR